MSKKESYLIEVLLIPPPFPTRIIKEDGKIKEEPEIRPPIFVKTVYSRTARDYIKANYPAAAEKGTDWEVYILNDRPLLELETFEQKAAVKQ